MAQDSKLLSLLNSILASRTTSLKMVVVGNEGVGKTSFVRRFVAEQLGIAEKEVRPIASSLSSCLSSSPSAPRNNRLSCSEDSPEIEPNALVQSSEVGLDIYEMKLSAAPEAPGLKSHDTRDKTLSIWDFTGKAENLYAIQEMFFTPQTLYVVVWDMAARDITPMERECAISLSENESKDNADFGTSFLHPKPSSESHLSILSPSFKLGCDSDSEDSDNDYHNDCDVDMFNQEEVRRTKRQLERDIDKKVQFWIDQIQSITPGATILPIATHMDRLLPHNEQFDGDKEVETTMDGVAKSTRREHQWKEVRNRCRLLKSRLTSNEARKLETVERIRSTRSNGKRHCSNSDRVLRPVFEFGSVQEDGQVLPYAVAVGCNYTENTRERENNISNGSNFAAIREFIFSAARARAAKEEDLQKEEPSRGGESHSDLYESSLFSSRANGLSFGVRECKVIQIDYLMRTFRDCNQYYKTKIPLLPADQKDDINYVLAALDSLHVSGKLCYFGTNTTSSSKIDYGQVSDTQLLSHFVILDPTWLVESINFILQYARMFVESNVSTGMQSLSSNLSKGHRASNCPTIEKEQARRLWKNQDSIKQGLAFAEHYSRSQYGNDGDKNTDNITDKVFEFIQCLLVRHKVFVPLSYQKSDSKHFFLPGLLRPKNTERKTSISLQNLLTTPLSSSSSVVTGLFHTSGLKPVFEDRVVSQTCLDCVQIHTACHGLVFVDTAPQSLMERVIVHMIKALSDILNPTYGPRVIAREIYCWKDSFRLKLQVHIDEMGKEETKEREVTCYLLEVPAGDTYSRTAACECVLVTYFQGCIDRKNYDIWQYTCSSLRMAIQNSLDEMQIEYREEAICPECLRKKPVNEIGTWTYGKLRSAVDDEESFIRCRHGHRIKTNLDAFLNYQLRRDPEQNLVKCDTLGKRSRSSTCSSTMGSLSLCRTPVSASSVDKQHFRNELCLKGSKRDALSTSDDVEVNRRLPTSAIKEKKLDKINTRKKNLRLSFCGVFLPSGRPKKVKTSSHTEDGSNETRMESANDYEHRFRLELDLLFEQCEAKMKRFFFKKSYLSLENLNMTEFQIPMKDLKGTKFGHDLQSLSLAHNKLEALPKSLVHCLPNLRSINLSHCLIYELPNEWNLPSLKKLNISHNLLIDFPEENTLLGLLELQELNLSDNKLTKVEVSPNPDIFRKLKRLDLSSNELTSFPCSLDRFAALIWLDLRCNYIDCE